MPRIALYPGSFDPITNGHLDVFRRAVELCDRLIVAIGVHPGKKPLFTVEESRRLRGKIPGGHTKNLFLKDKRDQVFLVVAPEDAAIELKTLHHKLGAGRFSFGSADLMRTLIGVEPVATRDDVTQRLVGAVGHAHGGLSRRPRATRRSRARLVARHRP